MLRVVWFVNLVVLSAFVVTMASPSSKFLNDTIEIATKVFLAIGYGGLSLSLKWRTPKLETAILSYLMTVYLCIAIHLSAPVYNLPLVEEFVAAILLSLEFRP